VGDLINRGSQSKEVVEFVRKNAFAVVRGNHEEYLLKYGSLFFEYMRGKKINNSPIWVYKAISSTLRSYGVLNPNSSEIIFDKDGIEKLIDDMNWISKLPLYLELGYRKGYNLPVVVTHGSVDKYWLFKDTFPEYFEYHVLNNRNRPSRNAPIFNIYGHKSNQEVVIGSNFVSLDTGCGKRENGKLSAYCLESKEVISVRNPSFYREVA
jgi:serine/threonine protein phosphatase 1